MVILRSDQEFVLFLNSYDLDDQTWHIVEASEDSQVIVLIIPESIELYTSYGV